MGSVPVFCSTMVERVVDDLSAVERLPRWSTLLTIWVTTTDW